MMAKSWDASRLKARFPARKKGAGKALMGRRVSAVRAIWLGRVLEEHPADGERKAEG